ncbi:hypothetical protein [Alicyclobacillus fodiniaquatilis]|uniref:Secreted protein n=1 Tax=Alicyclobacillus fodiniaquatilis TaxID=1661150 RepID=A0ABW4JFT0_9BACL
MSRELPEWRRSVCCVPALMQARLAASIAVGITNPSPSPATAMMASTTMGHIDEKYRAHQNPDSNHPPRIGPSRKAIMALTIGLKQSRLVR